MVETVVKVPFGTIRVRGSIEQFLHNTVLYSFERFTVNNGNVVPAVEFKTKRRFRASGKWDKDWEIK